MKRSNKLSKKYYAITSGIMTVVAAGSFAVGYFQPHQQSQADFRTPSDSKIINIQKELTDEKQKQADTQKKLDDAKKLLNDEEAAKGKSAAEISAAEQKAKDLEAENTQLKAENTQLKSSTNGNQGTSEIDQTNKYNQLYSDIVTYVFNSHAGYYSENEQKLFFDREGPQMVLMSNIVNEAGRDASDDDIINKFAQEENWLGVNDQPKKIQYAKDMYYIHTNYIKQLSTSN